MKLYSAKSNKGISRAAALYSSGLDDRKVQTLPSVNIPTQMVKTNSANSDNTIQKVDDKNPPKLGFENEFLPFLSPFLGINERNMLPVSQHPSEMFNRSYIDEDNKNVNVAGLDNINDKNDRQSSDSGMLELSSLYGAGCQSFVSSILNDNYENLKTASEKKDSKISNKLSLDNMELIKTLFLKNQKSK